MSEGYRILFIGDVVGRPGRTALRDHLRSLQEAHQALFTIVNAENSAGGVGITSDIAEEIFALGVDAITLGNHAFNKREIYGYLDSGRAIVRPANMPEQVPGRGMTTISKDGISLAVANACGRIFMDSYDDPFACVERLLTSAGNAHFLLDFHAEATSEKIAMGLHLDGRASAVLGTHTHVTTADEQVLPGGTAYITDVGMTGPTSSVLGMDPAVILARFRTTLPERFEVAKSPGVICGVAIDVERNTGRARSIERVRAG